MTPMLTALFPLVYLLLIPAVGEQQFLGIAAALPFLLACLPWHAAGRVVIATGLMAIKTAQLALWEIAHTDDYHGMTLTTALPRDEIALIILWCWCFTALDFLLTRFVLKQIIQDFRDAGMYIPATPQQRDILIALFLIDWILGATLGFALTGGARVAVTI